jgi:hypothetical protein
MIIIIYQTHYRRNIVRKAVKPNMPVIFAFPSIFLTLYAALSAASCVTAGVPPPEWAASPAAITRVYPDSAYIARVGRGKTREAAEVNGAAEIARFFTSQISVESSYRLTERYENGRGGETLETEDTAFVTSEINLFGIRYAHDPFYNKVEKEWRTVAYIDRAEAWDVYALRFQKHSAAFHALYEAAEGEANPFKKVLVLQVARNYARSAEFEAALALGQMLHPLRMNTAFAPVRAEIAALPRQINEAKTEASIFVDCPVDLDGAIRAALTGAISGESFPVSKDRATASAVCFASVDEGLEKRDAGTFYTPVLTVSITGKTGAALFSMTINAPRKSAVNPDIARRRAYTALAGEIQTQFHREFEKQITAKQATGNL